MDKKSFDQKFFMSRIDKRRESLGITKAALGKHAGRDGSSYDAWEKGREAVKIEYAVLMCQKLDILPAWAFFDEGPKTIEEANALGNIRSFVAEVTRTKPASFASSEPALLELQSETIALTELERDAVLKWMMMQVSYMPVENPLTIACRKIATVLARDTAPSARPETQDKAAASRATVGKDAPIVKVPPPQVGQKH